MGGFKWYIVTDVLKECSRTTLAKCSSIERENTCLPSDEQTTPFNGKSICGSFSHDIKSTKEKWSASPHFCIINGLIIHPQMFSLLKLSLDTLVMYVCFIFYALSCLLISNSHRKWQENEEFQWNFVDIFFYFLRSKL